MRENLIRSAVGPRALDLKLLLRGGPASFFPAPRDHGAVIKARRVSGRVPPGVRCSGPTPSGASSASLWLDSLSFLHLSFRPSSKSSHLSTPASSQPPLRHLLPVLRVLRLPFSLSSSRSRYLNCPSAEIFSRIANLWTSPLADRANDVLVCTYERARAREQERVIGNGRVRGRRGGRR